MRTFTECFPDCGVIGEENSLMLKPKNGCRAYFTVDPIDGTRAYIRRQSHGIATMVGMVLDRQVISAYIGDICADEVYGYRPGSKHVHRITRLDTFDELLAPEVRPVGEVFVLLRDPIEKYGPLSKKTLPHFKNYEVMGSSIGTWMARLWKREIGAALLPPGAETPWDSTPVIGISRKLGYVFMRPDANDLGWVEYEPELPTVVAARDHDTLIVHENIAEQFAMV